MIFVTVGTHEQSFNRLIKEVDLLIKNKIITEEVIMQIGFSSYKPYNCKWYKFLPYEQMQRYIREARIVIVHGGPASFIAPLQFNKVPIVVPRQLKYKEHVNNHQVEFVRLIKERLNNIIPVYNINELKNVVLNYDALVANDSGVLTSNNKKFNKHFEKLVDNLFEE